MHPRIPVRGEVEVVAAHERVARDLDGREPGHAVGAGLAARAAELGIYVALLPTWGDKSWFNTLYPGNDVVDWLAEDPYIIGPKGSWYDNDYAGLVNRVRLAGGVPSFVPYVVADGEWRLDLETLRAKGVEVVCVG